MHISPTGVYNPYSYILRSLSFHNLSSISNIYLHTCAPRFSSVFSPNTSNDLHKPLVSSPSRKHFLHSHTTTMKPANESPITMMMIDESNINTTRTKHDRKQDKKRAKHRNKKQQEQYILREYLQESSSASASAHHPGRIPTRDEFGFTNHNNHNNNHIHALTATTTSSTHYDMYQHLSEKERATFNKKFTIPRTITQEHYARLLKNHQKKIIVVNGPAGTGKTMFATEYGIRYFLTDVYDKLIFTRPSVSVDEDLGYLPGTLEDKMAPWIRPIYDVLYQFLTAKEIQTLIEDKKIEIAPLGYMRGRTFKNTWIVADEMQNSTIAQMKMLLTRIGENSRLVVTGDLQQHDKPYELNGLDDFLQRFKGSRSSSITSMEFERDDVQREEVVKEVLDIYARDELPEYFSGTEDGAIEATTDESLQNEQPSSPDESILGDPEQHEDYTIIEDEPNLNPNPNPNTF